MKESPGSVPCYAIAINADGKIIGTLLGTIFTNGKGIRAYLSRRLIIWGGPLLDSESDYTCDLLSEMMEILLNNLKSKCIYIEIRNQFDTTLFKTALGKLGFKFYEHLNYLVQFDQNTESRIHKSKQRQNKRSLQNGIQWREASNIHEVMEFYKILADLFRKKVKKPLPEPEFFKEFFKNKSLGVYLLVFKENTVIGGMMCPIFGTTIYEWYTAAKTLPGEKVYPGVVSTMSAIRYGIDSGLKSFDFLGAGKPDENYGVRSFKAQFGGTLVNYGRYRKITKPLLYGTGSAFMQLMKYIPG